MKAQSIEFQNRSDDFHLSRDKGPQKQFLPYSPAPAGILPLIESHPASLLLKFPHGPSILWIPRELEAATRPFKSVRDPNGIEQGPEDAPKVRSDLHPGIVVR